VTFSGEEESFGSQKLSSSRKDHVIDLTAICAVFILLKAV